MKPIYFSPLLSLLLLAPFGANAAGSGLRVTCEGDDVGAEVLVNGKFRGECPLDMQVPEGTLKLLVRKKVDAQRERVFEQEVRIGEGSAKRIEVSLGTAKLNAGAKAQQESNRQRWRNMSFDALQKEAESGNAEAMRHLAARYWNGSDGAPKDKELFMTWLRKAAEAGDAYSMNMLGQSYHYGINNLPKNDEQAILWLRKAAAVGYGSSMTALGDHYDSGSGVAQNHVEAAQWYRKAADAGNALAMSSLGILYMGGKGVPQSYEQAVAWHRKAVEADENDTDKLGNKNGMFWLGTSYKNGWGVPQDEQQAIYWWRKAVEGKYPNDNAVEELKKRGLR